MTRLSGRSQQLRIIGGQHRGRILSFLSINGLRPTPDRVRETLFNWLQPVIEGACCLDLFSGSGALGLEAASRGAATVVMVESSTRAAEQIRKHVNMLGLEDVHVIRHKAREYLKQCDLSFDVVFLDPPYRKGQLLPICNLLEENHLLRMNARVYLESEQAITQSDIPENWHLIRAKQAGQVFYHLAERR
ncbi:MAG: 16S rRNA (guanine(966)-N(2))-methyltransferase RsmD [Gammaproteobacteria bacterium]|nr:MAG: 16S rRNA (guanine(966)-N(2))-methyltransferase RsmD [Gammaproteobacteria bacterium]